MLYKGFLRPRIKIRLKSILTGLILWLIFSYILYAFLYLSRESLRTLTYGLGYGVLLILDKQENYYYNLFSASIATAFAYQFSLRFFLLDLKFWKYSKTKTMIRRTLNDQGAFSWYFMSWFVRLGSLYGISLSIMSLQYEFSFLNDFPYLLVLLPIILFLSSWPSLRRVLGRSALKWFPISSALFLILSFSLAFKNFIPFKRINHNIQMNDIEYAYELNFPASKSSEPIERISFVTYLLIVRDSTDVSKELIFVDNIDKQIELSEISELVREEKNKVSEIEKFQYEFSISTDERISLNFVNKVKHELRKAGIFNIHYSTRDPDSKYPKNHPIFKFQGVHQSLWPRYYSSFESLLDSVERLDPSEFKVRLSDSYMYRVNKLKGYNRVELVVKEDSLLLNNQFLSENTLEIALYKFFKNYPLNSLMIFSPEENISFGKYIKTLDIYHCVIDELRNEMALDLYNKKFSDLFEGQEEYQIVLLSYSKNIIEWTPEEKRLLKLMEKTHQKPF